MRRAMTQAVMAERVGVSVPTIAKLESGDASISMATLVRFLNVLGLSEDIDAIADSDVLGRQLQDNALKGVRTSPKRSLE